MSLTVTRTRVLHGLGALVAGGAERACVDLALAQKAAGLDVAIACLSPRGDAVGDRWRRLLSEAGVPVESGPTRRVSPRSVMWLRTQLVSPSVAIFHIHLDNVVLAYYLARKLHRRGYGVLRKLANMHVEDQAGVRWALEHCDIRHLVAGGESTARHLAGRFPGKLYCVPNGMHFHWPVQDDVERAQARTTLQLDDTARHWVMVGRMTGPSPDKAQKAHNTLIRAWREARAAAHGGTLHLLGDGNLRPLLEDQAKGDQSIIFHGSIPDVDRWLLASDCFCLCTRWEGLPNAAIEAAGTGLPMLLTDIPPCREIGAASTTFAPVDDVPGWAQKISNGLIHPLPRADGLSVTDIRARYGIDRPLTAYLEIYREIWPGQAPEAVRNVSTRMVRGSAGEAEADA